MKRKWKIILFIALIAVISGGVFASIKYNERGIVGVQTGKAVKQDLTATVTASGEIKPKNYINLGTNTFGAAPITGIMVKEGDHVRKGQVVATLESVQANADVVAQKAAIDTSLADSAAAEAGMRSMSDAIRTAQATVDRSKTELERTKLNMDRATELYKQKLIAKQDYDQKKAEYDTAISALGEAQARVQQAQSQEAQSRQQLDSAQKRIAQVRAALTRYSDVLQKYSVTAPIDGIVTNLPVRVGETVVPGIQNSASSTIMTIADMSLITSEVKVDETDIVNVKLDQAAEITIDAMPGKTFKGHVVEIGNTAILRSTGLAASQSAVSSQEAKDFTRQHVLTIPIQALTVRQRGELEPLNKGKTAQAADKEALSEKAKKEELQGVFVVQNGKAEFKKVATGITGATDIEVLTGLNEGDQIVTGTYKVIRTLRNSAKVKVENKAPGATKSES